MGLADLRFGQPTHGWLDVSLEAESGRQAFKASHVPYDSLMQLANAALAISDGQQATVIWSLEPEYEEWTIGVSSFSATLMTSSLSITAQPIEIARIIMRGLSELQSRWPEHGSSATWCHEFPKKELQDLKAKVRLD